MIYRTARSLDGPIIGQIQITSKPLFSIVVLLPRQAFGFTGIKELFLFCYLFCFFGVWLAESAEVREPVCLLFNQLVAARQRDPAAGRLAAAHVRPRLLLVRPG